MVDTVFFLVESPLSLRDHERFGVGVLSRDFKVVGLDCTPWLKPRYWEEYSGLAHEFPGYSIVGGPGEFNTRLEGLGNAIAIDVLGSCTTSRGIREELRRRGITRAIFNGGAVPSPGDTLVGKILTFLHEPDRFRRVLGKLHWKTHAIRDSSPAADIAILSAEICLKYPDLRATRQVWAHSFDYDTYLECRNQAAGNNRPYALLLDENLVHHSDWLHWGVQAPVTTQYFSDLNGFLDRFEQDTGHEVVIAGHPRSRYDQLSEFLGGRKVIPGRTAELTRNATLVLGHVSTALSFAVLWHKPIVFITTDELQRSFMAPYIECRRKIFNAPLINMSHHERLEIDWKSIWQVNERAYAYYKRMYIKRPGTPERPFWEIFSDYVRRT